MAKVDKNIKKYCVNCGNPLVIKSNRDIIKKRFCSWKCNGYFSTIERQKRNPELLNKFILAGQTSEANKKKGLKLEKHPRWAGETKCICQQCQNPFNIRSYKLNQGRGKFCSKKCYKLYHKIDNIKFECLNCGKEIWDKPLKKRIYCSCSCKMIHLLPKQKFEGTDIEIKIKQFLEDKNIPFDYQPRIKDIVNADFLIKPNIVIFADGDYWHNLPHAIQRDKIVNEKLNENNYVVLRFKGTEINKNFNLVQNKIEKVLNAIAQ